jgi:hypothetical protein
VTAPQPLKDCTVTRLIGGSGILDMLFYLNDEDGRSGSNHLQPLRLQIFCTHSQHSFCDPNINLLAKRAYFNNHPPLIQPHKTKMLSSLLITCIVAASTVFASPGPGYGYNKYSYTTCSTSLCTSSSVYTKPTTIYQTKTIYVPYTSYSYAKVYTTKTLTSKSTKTITTSTASVITTYVPVISSSVYDVPYTTIYTENAQVPYTTTSASASVCPVTSGIPYTTSWVNTKTACSVAYIYW